MEERPAIRERQAHHDYWVRLKREGRLLPADQWQYALAMEREKRGIVNPLPEAEK